MTHFAVVVFTNDPSEAEVARLLAPFDETAEDARDPRWDWWVIGGRWEGALTGREPLAVEVACDICGGSGTRPDAERFDASWRAWSNGCNGCMGTGKRTEYPNQYENDVTGNTARPAAITRDFVPAAFVTPSGEWIEDGRTGWWGIKTDEHDTVAQWAARFAEAKGAFADTYAVLVDCHV